MLSSQEDRAGCGLFRNGPGWELSHPFTVLGGWPLPPPMAPEAGFSLGTPQAFAVTPQEDSWPQLPLPKEALEYSGGKKALKLQILNPSIPNPDSVTNIHSGFNKYFLSACMYQACVTSLLCDLGHMLCHLWVSVSSPEKQRNWAK